MIYANITSVWIAPWGLQGRAGKRVCDAGPGRDGILLPLCRSL